MASSLEKCTGLGPSDLDLLRRVAESLNLLADIMHADLLLFARAERDAVVVAQAQPQPVPSLYGSTLAGEVLSRGEAGLVFEVLFGGRPRHLVKGTLVRGVPTMQEVFPITNDQGETIAVLCSEMALLEHERQRKKSPVYRRAVARIQELVLSGQLQGVEMLGRMGVHDGPMVIEAGGQILYISAIAEHLYRRLGYADSLMGTQIAELDTNEYICFKAMELGTCLEQRIQEHEFVWIKRVIPLLPPEGSGLFSRLRGATQRAGALVVIQDITDEVRKEQELKIKSAMIQEIHHRVKNNLQTIAALLRLQARRATSPDVSDMLTQSINRILSIAVVHEFLSQDETSMINIHEVGNRILNEMTNGVLDPEKSIRLTLIGSRNFSLPAQQATSCALIINELLQNAVEHGYTNRAEGEICVRLSEDDSGMRIEIQDDGRGLPADFQMPGQGGLGLQIVQTLVREDLKGQFQLVNGRGVTAVISFPKVSVARGA